MRPRFDVVGAGPGGLMAAEVLALGGGRVTVHERMPSAGRKLLLAGRGGLNLTHTEPLDAFLARYGDARPRLEAAVRAFGADDVRAWAAGLGQECFVGSSGRVFPQGFRATPLLRAWLRRLAELGVEFRFGTPWPGFDAPSDAGAIVLALGGGSWPRTGSDGGWVPILRAAGVEVRELRPANCGFRAAWSATFAERFAGAPLKNVVLDGVRGDAMITATGIEGGAVYALAAPLRDAIEADGAVTLHVDVVPDRPVDEVAQRLSRRPRDSMASALRRAGIAAVAGGLAREATANELPEDPLELARLLKAVPIRLVDVQPIDRAISSAGGIALDEVDESFMLHRRPGVFVAGEMLDWAAPTGGYLLQATFSTAVAAARGALSWLAGDSERRPPPT